MPFSEQDFYNDYFPSQPPTHPGLGTFTPYDSQTQSLSQFLSFLLGNVNGIVIDEASLNFIGTPSAASTFTSLNLGNGLNMPGPGILLTSGDGAPALTNSQSSFSVNNAEYIWIAYDEPYESTYDYTDENGDTITESFSETGYWQRVDNGDDELTQIAQQAFSGAGATQDAAILEFSFSVTDASIRSISFDLIFGSEEFPYFIDSPFVDIAAVIVNGTNYAYIDGNIDQPLSIVGATIEDGRFLDNTIDHGYSDYDTSDTPLLASPYQIEYNGLTPVLTISIPLQEDTQTYQVRIGIADTGDGILDSGLFISNFQALTSSYSGTLVNVEADDEGSVLTAPAAGTATKFVGGSGNDTMTGSTAPDVYDLQKGGANTIKGSLAQLDQDTVIGFTEQDTLSFVDSVFEAKQLSVVMGSAILAIDGDGDGQVDGTLVLEGDYRFGTFVTDTGDSGTEVRYVPLATTPDQVLWVGGDEDEITISESGLTKLLGDSAGKTLTIAQGSSVMNVSAGTHIKLEDYSSEEVQLLRDGTTLWVVDLAGNPLVQMAASPLSGWGSLLTLSDGTLTLEADQHQQALQLLQDLDTSAPLVFSGDGDRFLAATWLGEAELLGVQAAHEVSALFG